MLMIPLRTPNLTLRCSPYSCTAARLGPTAGRSLRILSTF